MKKVILLLQKHRYFAFFMFLILLSADILAFKYTNDLFLIFLFFIWLINIVAFSLEARFSALAALLSWAFSLFLVLITLETSAEKSAIWTYLFLLAAFIQLLLEQKTGLKNKTKLEDLYSFVLKERINESKK